MLPDIVVKYLANYIGNAIGGVATAATAAEAVALSITGAEFVNLQSRMRDGTATSTDIAAAVTAVEASLIGARIILTAGGVIEGAGLALGGIVATPLVVAIVAAVGAAVWYERNAIAIQDGLAVLTAAISREEQPWTFLPKVWEAYKKESYHREVNPQTNIDWRAARTPVRRDPLAIDLGRLYITRPDPCFVKGKRTAVNAMVGTPCNGVKTTSQVAHGVSYQRLVTNQVLY